MNVPALVPGDFIELRLGDIVPADVRLVEVTGLECDESVLTGESLPADKNTDPVPVGTALAELSGCSDRPGRACRRRARSRGDNLRRYRVREDRRRAEHPPNWTPNSRSGSDDSPCCGCRSVAR